VGASRRAIVGRRKKPSWPPVGGRGVAARMARRLYLASTLSGLCIVVNPPEKLDGESTRRVPPFLPRGCSAGTVFGLFMRESCSPSVRGGRFSCHAGRVWFPRKWGVFPMLRRRAKGERIQGRGRCVALSVAGVFWRREVALESKMLGRLPFLLGATPDRSLVAKRAIVGLRPREMSKAIEKHKAKAERCVHKWRALRGGTEAISARGMRPFRGQRVRQPVFGCWCVFGARHGRMGRQWRCVGQSDRLFSEVVG
jgi:hypothetical protein